MTVLDRPQSLEVVIPFSMDRAWGHFAAGAVRRGLVRLFPGAGALLSGGVDLTTPVSTGIKAQEEGRFTVFLACLSYPGVEQFFYEMLSRYLLPGRRACFSFSFSTEFSFLKKAERYTFCEVGLVFESEEMLRLLQQGYAQIAPELRVGASSFYQGRKVLELKGHFSSEKNALIHERLTYLLHQRPSRFDYDLFGQMQHFLARCEEGFKQAHEARYLSRIISFFYLFRRSIKERAERSSFKRHISFKAHKVRLFTPFGERQVLGVAVGLNFLKQHEIFTEEHLLKGLEDLLGSLRVVTGSLYSYYHPEEKVRVLYLEVDKEGGFSVEDIRKLRRRFPLEVEKHIEKVMPALFMPRNEEEVMKNVVLLAEQLKYVRDLPQVMISFEGQDEKVVTFTVVVLRVLLSSKEKSAVELFAGANLLGMVTKERARHAGLIRGKYPKEATVFRFQLPKELYVRKDRLVDLFKARQEVVKQVERVLGEFRDYNGGMMAGQGKNLRAFKSLLEKEEVLDELLAEDFFHGITPIEMRGVVLPVLLKKLYLLWKEFSEEEEDRLVTQGSEDGLVVFGSISLQERRQELGEFIEKQGLSSSQVLYFMPEEERLFGYILVGLGSKKQESMQRELKEFTLKRMSNYF